MKLIKQFNKLPLSKKVLLLFILLMIVLLPIATTVSLKQKNINSKAAEMPTSTPTPPHSQGIVITGGVRIGTTTPCGGLNQRCCSSIPSCTSTPNQTLICYSGFCRTKGTITISPRIIPTNVMNEEDTREVGIGTYKPTLTPTPTPTNSPTPTPISSIWIP